MNDPLILNKKVAYQIIRLRHMSPETGLVHSFADFFLDFVDGVLQALGDGVTPQRVHVEAVCRRWEDQENHHL